MNKLSSFIFEQLSKNSTIDYSVVNNNDDEIGLDDADDTVNNNYGTANYNNNNNKHIVVDYPEIDSEFDEDCSDDHGQNPYHLKVSKQTFQGMRIFDTINPAKTCHYVKIFVNNKQKYIHKQTAVRMLTINKNSLSSDRQIRVQQTKNQN
ncbi:unnamed protein product [Adineta steineri]|uniref:Uncharacterized protein n=1 Tax=Adineta steineri TaxID=433720 RepID=A0A819G816_9BILA|nr:unnamed protein product [Adineta steineri]CAF3881280.1 unnamed protein product [Adineta steineri]